MKWVKLNDGKMMMEVFEVIFFLNWELNLMLSLDVVMFDWINFVLLGF